MSNETAVDLRLDGPIARITLGSGTRHNAMDDAGWDRLAEYLAELAKLDTVRAVLIGGRGGSFCAGSDMTVWVGAETEVVEESFVRMEAAFRAVEACPVPVVAKIDGAATGAGCQLALACDLRVMAQSARIGMPIVRLGILTSPSFAARIVELAGPSVTREMLYTGRLFTGAEAVRAGLVNQCVPEAELTEHAETMVRRIAEQPPAALRAAKRAVTDVLRPGREAGDTTAHRAVSEVDFQRGIAEFLDR